MFAVIGRIEKRIAALIGNHFNIRTSNKNTPQLAVVYF